jgi:protoporphyrinogen IX oxidase
MLWVKSFHIIFMVTWFAGIFYLPRLFVYHAMATDTISIERFKVMERKLFFGITTPGALLTLIFGIWLVSYNPVAYLQANWLNAKLLLVFLLIAYHIYCGYLLVQFKYNNNKHSHVYYRWLNEFPVLLLVGIVILAVVKPAL